MAGISIERVSKRYGPVAAVRELSLEVRDREFLTLLGPSGCGKTTLLRMIAGFLTPDAGTIRVDGLTLSSAQAVVPPERRGMGMVFQNYAIWPHKTVYENVAFGLEVRRVPRADARERVGRVLELVNLGGARAALPGRALRRPAAARGAGPEPGCRAEDPPARRAPVESRREAPRADAVGAQGPPATDRDHLRLRHPRSGRGDGAVRPDRGPSGRRRSSRRARHGTSTRGRPAAKWRTSWAW